MSDRQITPNSGTGPADRDHARHLIELADKTLGEVGAKVTGASPNVTKLFHVVSSRVNDARNMALSVERDIISLLDDDRVYPAGRYKDAAKKLADAQGKVDALKQAQVAALSVTKVLEEDAMPKFEPTIGPGTFWEEKRERSDEVRDILSRSSDHVETLRKLARETRYAGLVASEFGRSLLIGRVADREVEDTHRLVRSEALLWVGEHGTDAQRNAVERIGLGEKMQGAVLAASNGAQMKLEPLAARVKALGERLAYDEARRVREAGQAR